MTAIESWGRVPKIAQKGRSIFWTDQNPGTVPGGVLAHGLGRSYGDVCLNGHGEVILTRHLDRVLAFDADSGVVRCEAGVSYDRLLELAVPRGWFPPVTPGTRFVTLGGAVANDVHGKNHHRAGCLGNHVLRFELARSDGARLVCSPREHTGLFAATIGGLGLTGLMTWIEIQLQPVQSAWIDTEVLAIKNVDHFLEVTEASDDDWEYTVAWIDGFARGARLGRGVFFRGNHGPPGKHRRPPSARQWPVPTEAPGWLLNDPVVRLFNRVYRARQRLGSARKKTHYRPFFYPLDAVANWNRLYGRRGFLQYQFVVPNAEDLVWAMETAQKAGVFSYLSVLKKFGTIASPGLLSFPRPGLTLAMDVPYRPSVLPILARLDQRIAAVGGAVYPAKDARMSPAAFGAFFPAWREFEKHIDPGFASTFWRRVTGSTGEVSEPLEVVST